MNAILIGPCKTRVPIDGSLSNAFEYFYFAWQRNKDMLLIIDCSKEALEIVKKYLILKYEFDLKALDYIILYRKKILKLNNLFLFELIAIDNFEYYSTFLKAKNLYALSGSKNHTLNCTYFVEYEHLRPMNERINYTSKIYFEILKKPRFQKNLRFVNTRNPEYKKKPNEIVRSDLNLVSNIFEQFSEMVYIQHPICFDLKPRIFQELMFFDIPFTFIEYEGCLDGANYRAKDFDLDKRRMTEDDEILNILIYK